MFHGVWVSIEVVSCLASHFARGQLQEVQVVERGQLGRVVEAPAQLALHDLALVAHGGLDQHRLDEALRVHLGSAVQVGGSRVAAARVARDGSESIQGDAYMGVQGACKGRIGTEGFKGFRWSANEMGRRKGHAERVRAAHRICAEEGTLLGSTLTP